MIHVLTAAEIILCIALSAVPGYAREKDGISVSVKDAGEGEAAEFRAETTVVSTLSGAVALFEDIDAMPEWVYRLKKAEILKRISPAEVIVRTVTGIPPLEDRDAVIDTVLTQDSRGILRITAKDMSSFSPPQKGVTRISGVRSCWEFTPVKGGKLKAVFSGSGDPGGVIPLWLYNRLAGEAPYSTMKNFRKIIGNDRYQRAVFSYIKEYPEGIAPAD
ncbi:MAG: hypothetical protein ACRCUT_01585 [Spirochaetota bacterium]